MADPARTHAAAPAQSFALDDENYLTLLGLVQNAHDHLPDDAHISRRTLDAVIQSITEHRDPSKTKAALEREEEVQRFDFDHTPDVLRRGPHVKVPSFVAGEVRKSLLGIQAVVAVLTGSSLAKYDEDRRLRLSDWAEDGLRTAIDAMATLSADVLGRVLNKEENYFDGHDTVPTEAQR